MVLVRDESSPQGIPREENLSDTQVRERARRDKCQVHGSTESSVQIQSYTVHRHMYARLLIPNYTHVRRMNISYCSVRTPHLSLKSSAQFVCTAVRTSRA